MKSLRSRQGTGAPGTGRSGIEAGELRGRFLGGTRHALAWLPAIFLLLAPASSSRADMDLTNKVLKVYAPGGIQHTLQECADIFLKRHGIRVEFVKGYKRGLERQVGPDGDLFFGGWEGMLDDFMRGNKGEPISKSVFT